MPRKRHRPIHDPRGRGTAQVVTLAWEYASGHHVVEHFHDEDQLVYAVSGVMTVRTSKAIWVVPARRAVWVPAKLAHAIDMAGTVAMKTLYLAPRLVKGLPRDCCVLHVSPLLQELVLRACVLGRLRRGTQKESHVVALLRDELEDARALPVQLPTLQDPRAQILADALMADPSDKRPLDELCRNAGASKRTIERAFRRETGMTFGKWRQQLSLVHGMRILASGAKVTTAALDAGYDSTSAFIAMFRRALGTTPTRWVAEASPGRASPSLAAGKPSSRR